MQKRFIGVVVSHRAWEFLKGQAAYYGYMPQSQHEDYRGIGLLIDALSSAKFIDARDPGIAKYDGYRLRHKLSPLWGEDTDKSRHMVSVLATTPTKLATTAKALKIVPYSRVGADRAWMGALLQAFGEGLLIASDVPYATKPRNVVPIKRHREVVW